MLDDNNNKRQRGYRKRMIEIGAECTRFNTTNKRLADQARMILKKGWFSNFEILEICQQVNREENQQDLTT